MSTTTAFLLLAFAIAIGGLLVEGIRRIHARQDIVTARLDLVTRRLDASTTRLDAIDARLSAIAEGTQLVVNDIRRRAKRRAREAAATEAP